MYLVVIISIIIFLLVLFTLKISEIIRSIKDLRETQRELNREYQLFFSKMKNNWDFVFTRDEISIIKTSNQHVWNKFFEHGFELYAKEDIKKEGVGLEDPEEFFDLN